MATERLLLRVDQQGAAATSAAVRKVGTSAKTAGGSVKLLRGALLSLGVGIGIREIQETVDTFIQIKNRVRLATASTEEYVKVSKKLLDISQETRAPLEATAELYRRLAINTRGLNFGQERLLELIKTINQSVVVSGATAKEARSGLIQLSQGFASGQIRGEEFRSVAEQLPGLLIAVADGLGLTIGKLRELAFAGGLTPELFAKAVESQAELIDLTFKQIIPTIEQAGIQLNNAFITFVGRINEATAGSESFRDVIGFVRDNMERLAIAAFSAAAGFTAYKVAAWLAVAATKALKVSIRSLLISTGIGAVVVALGLAIDLLIRFGLSTEKIQGVSVSGFNKIGAAITATWSTIKRIAAILGLTREGFSRFFSFLKTGFGGAGTEIVGGLVNKFKQVISAAKFVVNNIIGFFYALPEVLVKIVDRIPGIFRNLGARAANALVGPLQDALNKFIGGLNAALAATPGVSFQVPELNIEFKVPPAVGVNRTMNEISGIIERAYSRDYVGELVDNTVDGLKIMGRIVKQEYNTALGETIELLKANEAAEQKKQEALEKVKRELTSIEESEALRNKATNEEKNALKSLATLEKSLRIKREAAVDPLDASVERYQQAINKATELGVKAGVAVKDNEALRLAIEGQLRVKGDIVRLTLEQVDHEAEVARLINEVADRSPEFAQKMREARDAILESGAGLQKIGTGLTAVERKLEAEKKKQDKEAERFAEKIGSEVSSSLTDIFRTSLRGEAFDWAEFLADKSAQLFEESMEKVFAKLAESLTKLLEDATSGIGGGVEGGGFNLGAGFGAAIGIGGLLLSSVLQDSEADIQTGLAEGASGVEDVSLTRGIIAGDTAIPIYKVGEDLEDALDPTNEILIAILNAVSGGTGVIQPTAEEEATQLLNTTSPSLI